MEIRENVTSIDITSRVPEWTSFGLGVIAIVLWIVSVEGAKFADMTALGLMSLMGWTFYLGLAAIALGVVYELFRSSVRQFPLILLAVVLAIYIFGTSSAVEPVASLGDSWLHASFTQYILQHGAVLENYDARFSWPGAFSLASVLVVFVGHANALAFLRWFPLFIELIYLLPLYVIAHYSDVSRRAAWLGIFIFYSTNWIYQDYFSPQALGYLFYLVVIAAVFAGWRAYVRVRVQKLSDRLVLTRSAFSFSRVNGDEAVTNWSPVTTMVMILLIGIICLACALSHQLTPFAIILALGSLLITRRLGRPELILLAILFAVGWLSLGASNFWIGHLSMIFGSFGNIGSAVGSNVVSRVTGNPSHVLVTKLRIGVIGALYLAAGIGSLRRSAMTRSLELLVAVPVLLVVAQNYGGEGLMRVVLYALPFTSVLAGSLFFPRQSGPIRPFLPHLRMGKILTISTAITVFVALFGLSTATAIARGGNDAYESFSQGEVDAMTYMYDHAKSGEIVGSVIFYVPAGQRDFQNIRFFEASEGEAVPLSLVRSNFLITRPSYVILSRAQEAWGTLLAGYPKGWQTGIANFLLRHNYRVAAKWSTAEILKYQKVPPLKLNRAVQRDGARLKRGKAGR